MRILVISPSFVPQADSEAFCGGKWVLALKKAGADVVVFADPDHGECRPIDLSGAWACLSSNTLTIKARRKRSLAKSVSSALRYQTWAWARWTNEVVRVARRLHCEKPIDLVVSRSLPWDACIAAYWTARTLRRPWIANLNDPWDMLSFSSEPDRRSNRLYQILMGFWLRRCLRSAAKVTYPCARLAGYFARTGHTSHKAAIIPHVGWKSRGGSALGRFTLVHSGKLGTNEATGRRSSLPLLRGFAQFLEGTPNAKTECRLVFVGLEDPTTTKASQEFNLTDHVKSVGRVSYEESLRYIGESSACVLVEGRFKEGIFLPSKLADYLVACKPVLALSPRVGTVADLATGQSVFRVDPDDAEGVAAHLGFLYERFRNGELETCAPPESLAEQFEPQFIARRFLDLAEEVISRSSSVI